MRWSTVGRPSKAWAASSVLLLHSSYVDDPSLFQLTCCDTRTEIARFTTVRCHEGLFAGEWKSVLQLNPCSVDIDLIVLTFIIIEKKRRERDGDPIHLTPHDEDPMGDGGGSGEGESGVVGEL